MTFGTAASRHWKSVASSTLTIGVLALAGCGPPPPPAGESRFTNSSEHAQSPDLSAHYVDFTFNYPSTWTVVAQPTHPSSFVKLSPPAKAAGSDGETLAVTYLAHDDKANQAVFSQELDQLMQSGDPKYPPTDFNMSRSSSQIGGKTVAALAFTSTSMPDPVSRAPRHTFGKMIQIPSADATKDGVLIVLYATDAGDIHSADDLDSKAGMPIVSASFKLGR